MSGSPDSRHRTGSRTADLLHALDLQIRRAQDAADADHVHDLRVATRRFAQALHIFEAGIASAGRIRRELKPLMDAAGEVRDFDIAIKLIAKDNAAGEAKIVADIESKRAKAQSQLSAELQKLASKKAITHWETSISRSKPTGASDGAVLLAAQAMFDRGDKAGKAKSSPKALHRLRIAAKKLRYTLELGSNGISKKKIDKIGELQSKLGRIHDLEAVRELLKDYPGSKKLRATMRRKQRELSREFHKFWSAEFESKKRQQAWMSSIEGFANSLQVARRKPAARALRNRAAA